ncbi:uncharacterized protein LOC142646328 [Dermatophagoides pteronyssinus]|uniref:uncharacterized protein LOC142646328 n=1 Tax=Dermatophagoides pteronyssinus TaxID=6956 RepID=UPI003F675F17
MMMMTTKSKKVMNHFIQFKITNQNHFIIFILIIVIIINFINISFANMINNNDDDTLHIHDYNHKNHLHYLSSSPSLSSTKSLLNLTNSLTATSPITTSSLSSSSTTTTTTKMISYHRQPCTNSSDCDSDLICHNRKCSCPLGRVYFHFRKPIPTNSKGMCILYEQAVACKNNDECQDIDQNVICDEQWGRCRCKRGYYLNAKTKYCIKIQYPYSGIKSKSNNRTKLTLNSGNVNGKKISSSSSSSTILSRRPQYFRLDTSCQKKSEKLDCPAEYSYCFERKCQCWPEFQFWEDKEFSLSNAENNSAVSSLQLITKELIQIAADNVDIIGLDNTDKWNDAMKIGKCLRKLCDTDDDCHDNNGNNGRNTNLICNNTVCECPYGYAMHRETHICMKLLLRRPSCDLTCKVIGGLFASIFVLTLIYWCFYCCVAIVKNFHYHNRRHHRHHNQSSNNDNNHTLFSLLDQQRRRRSSSSRSNSMISFLKMDKPPTYDEVMNDDNSNNGLSQQPNYIEMQEILPRYCSLWKLETNLQNHHINNEEFTIIECQQDSNQITNEDDDDDDVICQR